MNKAAEPPHPRIPPPGKENWPPTYRKPWDSEVCLNGTTILFIYFFCAAGEATPSHRASKPVSGPSPSPAGWPSPQTWWSSMAILTGWWSAWRCCSGWWGWRGARGPQGPEGGSCRTIRPACSDLAAPERTGARLHRDRVEWEEWYIRWWNYNSGELDSEKWIAVAWLRQEKWHKKQLQHKIKSLVMSATAEKLHKLNKKGFLLSSCSL